MGVAKGIGVACAVVLALGGCFRTRYPAGEGDDAPPPVRDFDPAESEPPPSPEAGRGGEMTTPAEPEGLVDFDRTRPLDDLTEDEVWRLCRALQDWSKWAVERLNRGACVATARVTVENMGLAEDPIGACEVRASSCIDDLRSVEPPESCDVEAIRQCGALVGDFERCVAGSEVIVAEYDRLSCTQIGSELGQVPGGQTASRAITPCIELFEACPGAFMVIAR